MVVLDLHPLVVQEMMELDELLELELLEVHELLERVELGARKRHGKGVKVQGDCQVAGGWGGE